LINDDDDDDDDAVIIKKYTSSKNIAYMYVVKYQIKSKECSHEITAMF
jgi:hypothetical protein